MESIERVRSSLLVAPSATALAGGSELLLFRIESNRKKRVDYDEIIYLEADNKYCKVWVDADTYYISRRSLRDTLLMLPKTRFERVHRSYAIGYDYIDYIEGDEIKLRHIDKRIPKGNPRLYRGFADWDDAHTS